MNGCGAVAHVPIHCLLSLASTVDAVTRLGERFELELATLIAGFVPGICAIAEMDSSTIKVFAIRLFMHLTPQKCLTNDLDVSRVLQESKRSKSSKVRCRP